MASRPSRNQWDGENFGKVGLALNLKTIMKQSTPITIPRVDPMTGKELVITELQTFDGEVTIRSKFTLPRMLNLDDEHQRFLETFLRCRGVINAVERELGISYPTVKGKLDALLSAMDLKPIERLEKPSAPEKVKILEQLERGEISADEAKTILRGAK